MELFAKQSSFFCEDSQAFGAGDDAHALFDLNRVTDHKGVGHDIKISFPMIADVTEYLQAKAAVHKEVDYLRARTCAATVIADWRNDRNRAGT